MPRWKAESARGSVRGKWKQEIRGHVTCGAIPPTPGLQNHLGTNHPPPESRQSKGLRRRAPAALTHSFAGAKRQHGPHCGCAAPNPVLTCFCTSASLSAMAKAKLVLWRASSMDLKLWRSRPETKAQDRSRFFYFITPASGSCQVTKRQTLLNQ